MSYLVAGLASILDPLQCDDTSQIGTGRTQPWCNCVTQIVFSALFSLHNSVSFCHAASRVEVRVGSGGGVGVAGGAVGADGDAVGALVGVARFGVGEVARQREFSRFSLSVAACSSSSPYPASSQLSVGFPL